MSVVVHEGGANGNVRTDQGNTWTTGAQSFAAATSLLAPASGGLAPTADGSLGYDTTQDAWSVGGAGALNGKLPRVLSVQRGSSDTLTASVISTTETEFATSFSLPANYLIASKLVVVIATWEITSSASAPTLVLRLRLRKSGPTDVNLYANSAGATANNLAAVGVGNIWFIQGTAAAGAAVSVEAGVISHNNLSTTTVPMGRNAIAQPATVDTASAQEIEFTAQYGANTAGNSITLRQLIVLEMN